MAAAKSRFKSVVQAVKDGTAAQVADSLTAPNLQPVHTKLHKPAAALGSLGEALRDRINRLEDELAHAGSEKEELRQELERTKIIREKAGDKFDEFLFIDAENIVDYLPRDRLNGATESLEFEDLLTDIENNGQNDAITVRRTANGQFEVAAGRRRIEVCRRLQRSVLARVRTLDDQSMLRIQFSENERRTDISALERARWFSEVKIRLNQPSKDIALHFGVDPSTLSLYLRLARFPSEILERLRDPRRLAVLPARRIMEAIESDSAAFQRVITALDNYEKECSTSEVAIDPGSQIDVLIRAAEGRGGGETSPRRAAPDRKHIVHEGRRIGTLTRNGGQWVFRFATSIPDAEVHLLTERLGAPILEQ